MKACMQRYSKILTITGRGFAPPPLKKKNTGTGNNHANIKFYN